MRSSCRFFILATLAGASPVALGAAPASPPKAAPPAQTVTAGPQYEAGPLWSFLFGDDYRGLWTEPIQVPVLDLERFAGGLTAVKEGGGKQTRTLQFEGGNGREYRFRSVDKDPAEALPENLRSPALDYLARDQTSSGLPAGDLMMEPLLHAAGVLHVHRRLVVLPDNPRLGKFRKEFAGMLGTFEDDPEKSEPEQTPGFEKIARIVDTDELEEILRKDARQRVDARAYLRARLIDVYVGDWDRHGRQWDWGWSEADRTWKPIPKDRDQAFSRYDGFLVSRVASGEQQLGNFSRHYEDLVATQWAARHLDRWLLAGLDESVWQSEADDLAHRLTDEVVDAAVARLPPEYYEQKGADLARALKARRNDLQKVARRWYEIQASDVDVFATDEPERLHVTRTEEGLDLVVEPKGGGGALIHRRFHARDTEEVRVYLRGGDDVATVQGTGPIMLRVVGGDGADVLDDTQAGHTRFYDSEGENAVRYGPGTKVADRAFDERPPTDHEAPRDWGVRWTRPMWVSSGSETGLFVGAGITRESYGFRRHPYSARHTIRAGYATIAGKFRGEYIGDFRRTQSRAGYEIYARASGFEMVRFFGFGNETTSTEPDDFYRAELSQYTFVPALRLPIGRKSTLRVGPRVRYSELRDPEEHFIGEIRPYGYDGFGQAGLTTTFEWDTRDDPQAPRRGLSALVGAAVVPPVWDVRETFGEIHGEASGVVTASLPVESTLAARVGGKKVFGEFPFHEAAFIGGSRRELTVRGLRAQRYAGDAAVFGNLELRLRLGTVAVLVPTEVGVFGLADAGRVYMRNETSQRWHKAVGGGIWIAPVSRANTFTLSAAQSEGRTAYYLSAGFLF
jgi:hypothetical protein